jgi:hypothetical protein
VANRGWLRSENNLEFKLGRAYLFSLPHNYHTHIVMLYSPCIHVEVDAHKHSCLLSFSFLFFEKLLPSLKSVVMKQVNSL